MVPLLFWGGRLLSYSNIWLVCKDNTPNLSGAKTQRPLESICVPSKGWRHCIHNEKINVCFERNASKTFDFVMHCQWMACMLINMKKLNKDDMYSRGFYLYNRRERDCVWYFLHFFFSLKHSQLYYILLTWYSKMSFLNYLMKSDLKLTIIQPRKF